MTKKEQLLNCGFEEDPSPDGTVDLYLSVRDNIGDELCSLRLRADWIERTKGFAHNDEYMPIEVTIFNDTGYEVLMGEI